MERVFSRRQFVLALILILSRPVAAEDAPAGEMLTLNFTIQNLEPDVARQVGKKAEKLRKQIARDWLGVEMPVREDRCPIQVTIHVGRNAGVSQFVYGGGKVVRQSMRVEGTLEAVLAGVLPHEMTHIVLAHAVGHQVPRWADEGAACLAEDEESRRQREQRQKEALEGSRLLPLARLFNLREYPADIPAFYAQSCAVAKFLIEKKDRPTFLAFVREGSESGWDEAAKKHYGCEDVAALEAVWLAHLKESR